MARLKKKLKAFWLWLVSWIKPRWDLTVSYNREWGDLDDKKYVVKKFLIKKDNHLKFKTHENDVVEVRSPAGLNYRITTR